MKVIGYTRVSTREQADEGYSLANQRAAIERYCAMRGWDLVEVIEDAGYSGRSDERPGLQRALMLLAKRNGPKSVVVARLDRLTRSMKDLVGLVDLAGKRWGIVALDQDLNTRSATGRVVVHVIGAIAEWESDQLSERVSRGMVAAHAAARADGRQLGYQRSTPDHIVARIVKARNKGDSFRRIATRLDRQGVPTPGNGVRWYPSTVAHIYKTATKETAA